MVSVSMLLPLADDFNMLLKNDLSWLLVSNALITLEPTIGVFISYVTKKGILISGLLW